jgi:hypothetical protein
MAVTPPTPAEQPSPRAGQAGWLPHVRGALVLLHLLVITLMALPAPGEGMVREAWKDPSVQSEFAAWTERCNRLGIHVTPEEFENRLWDVASIYMATRERVLTPFELYYELCGTLQSWRMFAGPHLYPGRLEIDVAELGVWHPVYMQRDPAHAWMAAKLDHYRVRPVLYRFSWYQYVAGYEDFRRFASWIAVQARHDFPHAERVRVALVRARTPSPEEVRQGIHPEEKRDPEVVRDLEARR